MAVSPPHTDTGKGQPVVSPPAGRAVRETDLVECRPQEVARRVAREDAAGSVGAVGGRSEANDEHACVGVPEAGCRPAPVALVLEPEDLLAGNLLTPGHETRTSTAGDDLIAQDIEVAGAVGLCALGRTPAPRGVRHFNNTRSSRRDVIHSPIPPITTRYATWNSISGPTTPTVSPRISATP